MTDQELEALKAEVQEDLNKILVKMQNVPKLELTHNYDYGGRPTLGTIDEDEDSDNYGEAKESEALRQAAAIKQVLEILTSGRSYGGSIKLIEQYYNSTC